MSQKKNNVTDDYSTQIFLRNGSRGQVSKPQVTVHDILLSSILVILCALWFQHLYPFGQIDGLIHKNTPPKKKIWLESAPLFNRSSRRAWLLFGKHGARLVYHDRLWMCVCVYMFSLKKSFSASTIPTGLVLGRRMKLESTGFLHDCSWSTLTHPPARK